MLKQLFLACIEPMVMRICPWKIPKSLEKGPFWEQKWVKNGSKSCFSKSDPRPLGLHKEMKLAHFEPILIHISPFRDMYAPSCSLCAYLRDLWWNHLQLGRGV